MSEPGQSYRKPTVEELRSIFGRDSVFLPCRKKKALPKCWQNRTVLDIDADAIRKTDLAPQTGVLCGVNSGGLVCLDFDTPDGLEAFTSALPPDLRTTRVVGKPGRAKLFFRVAKHDAGKKRKLKRHGAEAGDYLANASQAIVAGIHHETGRPYRIEDKSPPFQTTPEQLTAWLLASGFEPFNHPTPPACACVVVCSNEEERKNPLSNLLPSESDMQMQQFAEIKKCIALLGAVAVNHSTPPARPCVVECSNEGERKNPLQNSLPPESDTQRNAEIKRRIDLSAGVAVRAAELPDGIRELFQKHVQERWHPQPAGRNRLIVEAVPVLIRRMSPARVLAVCMAWLQIHRDWFTDTEEQHAAETSAHIEATLATYRQNLKTGERGIYDSLLQSERDAFRVCRDLARCEKEPPPQFFLAAGELALRIEGHATAASRILQKLEALGIVSLVERGTRHAPGARGRANKWKWNMSLEPFERVAAADCPDADGADNSPSAVDALTDKKGRESALPRK